MQELRGSKGGGRLVCDGILKKNKMKRFSFDGGMRRAAGASERH